MEMDMDADKYAVTVSVADRDRNKEHVVICGYKDGLGHGHSYKHVQSL